MKVADKPFQFYTASYLTRINSLRASCLEELRAGLARCSDASIFYHTFQSLERHHFLTEGFSNDFAQWTLSALNYSTLAEQLAALDIRAYLELADLRRDLLKIVDEFSNSHPAELRRPAFEPFYFCEGLEVSLPLPWTAQTLEEFRKGVERLSTASFQFHFLASRLRLHLRTNDFSLWLAEQLGLENLARRVNQIDIYTNTLESARAQMLALIAPELDK